MEYLKSIFNVKDKTVVITGGSGILGTEMARGNGLGLYMVKKSVQALHGKVEVESEVGRYTKFTVELPAS